ncbi:MAG: prephenate dehydrogenase [Mycobacteriales bacterium]
MPPRCAQTFPSDPLYAGPRWAWYRIDRHHTDRHRTDQHIYEGLIAVAPASVGIVGTGLIGTSIGLALERAGVRALLLDADLGRVELAEQLGAGVRWEPGVRVRHAVLAVPPARVAGTLQQLQGRDLAATFSDVGSVKEQSQREAETSNVDMTIFCGGHPIAGRERSGPSAARPDLFEGRPWVLTPGPTTTAATVEAATELATACGAQVLTMTAAAHDEALALVSHVPQLVASLLAARLQHSPDDVLRLAGTGLRDTTRIAASDPALWSEVVAANRGPTRVILAELARDLDGLVAALSEEQTEEGGPERPAGRGGLAAVVHDLVSRGNAGRRRLPGKHGVRATYAPVPVVIEDAPGRLARLLADAADAGINVEDLVIEHAPGRPRGVAELAVRPDDAHRLADALRARGWSVHVPGAERSLGDSD